jgi:hypothetical protein
MMKIKKISIAVLVLIALTVGMTISVFAVNYSSADKTETNTNYMEQIIDYAIARDYDNAMYYTSLRNQKIIVMGLQDTYKTFIFDDLFCFSCAIYKESGAGCYITDDEMLCQGNVISNRVNDSRFPESIRDVLEQDGQYQDFYNCGVFMINRGDSQLELNAIHRSYEIAYRALCGDRAWNGYEYCPENVLYASQGYQGTGVWWEIGRTFFCYG